MTVVKAHSRLTGEWLPLPAAVLAALGWGEGEMVEVEVVDTDTALLTRSGTASGTVERPAPPRGRKV